MMNEQISKWLEDQFGNDRETIEIVFGEYLASAAEKLVESREALAAEDFPRLDRIAHTLKGNALMVGDEVSAQAAIALRDASKVSDGAAAAAAIDRLAELDAANRA